MKNVDELLLKQKPTEIMVKIRRNEVFEELNLHDVSREADTTYSHCVRVIGKLEEAGLVEKDKDGRDAIVSTTEKGGKVADMIEEMRSL